MVTNKPIALIDASPGSGHSNPAQQRGRRPRLAAQRVLLRRFFKLIKRIQNTLIAEWNSRERNRDSQRRPGTLRRI